VVYGIDTDFLVAATLSDHQFHESANQLIDELLEQKHNFALSPQTMQEFLHVVTDARRFPKPLSMSVAIAQITQWWQSSEVVRVFPSSESVRLSHSWLEEHKLGRKRILDTSLAAIMHSAGVEQLITNNGKDYELLGCFEITSFK